MREVRRIAEDAGLRIEFPPAAMHEVDAILADPGIDDPLLTDLSHLPFCTIDNPDSRDLDQALYIERDDADGAAYAVYYALADASYYVRRGTALFDEAAERGATYYLPGYAVPMLPRALSEGIVSLNEGEDRRALIVKSRLAANGECVGTELFRARVRSRRQLTYGGVQAYYDAPGGHELAGEPYAGALDLLREVGRARIARQTERDVVRYDRIQVHLEVDRARKRLVARGAPRNDVERYNEQISLLCNIQGALFLTRRVDPSSGLAGVFRVHPRPAPHKLDSLVGSIRELVTAHDVDASWLWRRDPPDPESLADYVDRLPSTRLSQALQRQAMLVNETSYFAMEPGEHYGIGASAYARFSSPMREMVGVLTHQMAFDQMAQARSVPKKIVQRIVARANDAKKMQKRITKRANKLALDHLFERDMELPRDERPVRAGTVMGVGGRVYVQLDEPPIDVKIYDAVDGARVGAPISLVVTGYQQQKGRWLFDVA